MMRHQGIWGNDVSQGLGRPHTKVSLWDFIAVRLGIGYKHRRGSELPSRGKGVEAITTRTWSVIVSTMNTHLQFPVRVSEP